MRGAAIVAYGALSSLGEGADAAGVGAIGEAAKVGITRDDELVRHGFARPFCARVALPESHEDRAARIFTRALAACVDELDRVLPGWRARRVGMALATSSGGMRVAERLFAKLRAGEVLTQQEAVAATYFAPMVSVLSAHMPVPRFSPQTLVLTACSASTIAIGLALRWLEEDACDLVLAGGFEAVSSFVASGFEVLRATTAQVPPRPFCVGRDGMSLGEGAALLALLPAAKPHPPALAYISGFAASSDAVHITAPDRTGDGLARAARGALNDAAVDPSAIDLVSAHATATPFNDAAEWQTMKAARVTEAIVHPAKAQIGHTLGAAGALETLACVEAMRRGVLPATPRVADPDPAIAVRALDRAERGTVDAALKLSAAFGGANASLVVTRTPCSAAARRFRDAYVSRAAHVEGAPEAGQLAARVGYPPEKLGRADRLVRAAVAAVAELQEREGSLEGAGIVVGHFLATLETNASYDARMRERGIAGAEPRRFPYTSPNAVAGECGVIFRLTGPGIAVGSGLHGGVEALAVAAELVRAGDADRIVVVAADEIDETARALASAAGYPTPSTGAVALLVTAEPTSYARITGIETAFQPATMGQPGHHALFPLTERVAPASIESASPWGFAKLTFRS